MDGVADEGYYNMGSNEVFTELLTQIGVPVSRNLEQAFMEVDETYSQFEDLNTPIEATQSKNGKSKRGPAFSVEDDKLIISGYLNIGQDPIVGNGQKCDGYWKRVNVEFHKYSKGIKRTPGSLMNRWSHMQAAVNKFCGYYEQVCTRNQSGNTEDDKINEAKTMYKEYVGVPFKFEHAWKLLRYEQKWITRNMNLPVCNDKGKGKGKKHIASPSTPDPLSLGEENSPTPVFYGQTERPGGRKAAKASLAKQKNDENQQSKLQATLDRMDENASKMHAEKMALMKEAMAAEKEKEDRAILSMDTTNLDTPTKAYYKIKKTEILKNAGVL